MQPDFPCPICRADIPMAGDERVGEDVFCMYCGTASKLTRELDDPDCELEEDV